MIDVCLVHAHTLYRHALAVLLSTMPDLGHLHMQSALDKCLLTNPDLTVSRMPVFLVSASFLFHPNKKCTQPFFQQQAVIVLGAQEKPHTVRDALHLGARGYLGMHTTPEHLFQAIRTVASGGVYLSDELITALTETSPSEQAHLTKREGEIAHMLAHGLDTKAVAQALNISVKTVHVHRANILGKLGVQNNVSLAHKLLQEYAFVGV